MQKIPKKAYKEKEKRNELKKAQSTLDLNNITPKISQSLVIDLFKYKLKEECGLRVEAKYVTKSVVFPASETQELDNYFKFKCTGQLPLDGKVPHPILTKTGKLSVDYQRIDAQYDNYHRILARLNLSVEKTGFSFTNKKYSGTIDVLAHDNNIKSKDVMKKRVIIDINTSAIINDRYNPLGWANDSIEKKDELMFKAIHYKLLAKYEWGIDDIPFYFMVFSSKNDWEYKIFKVKVDESTLEYHYNNLAKIKEFLDDAMANGWNAHPNYVLCRECPLSNTCKHFTDIPKVQEVFI
jgi:CRISPR/Cas system-associated exonuclease Cas4 (RecB family)